jgi:hypothetical protein
MARKFAAEPRSDRLVLSTCADEVRSRDKCIWRRPLPRRLRLRADLQCVIRKKFRGRHRRGTS